MRIANKNSPLLGVPLVLLVAALPARAQVERNPVVRKDAPDPGVLRVGHTYYMVTTSGNAPDAFPIRTSKDLAHWHHAGSVLPRTHRPSWAVSDFWAPEIHKVATHYVCYFTARDRSGKLCVGAATAFSPLGPYKDIGHPLVSDPRGGSIDPTEFEDGDGTKYLYWKFDGNAVHERCHIYVEKLTPDGLSLVRAPKHARSVLKNDRRWEGSVVEAPEVERHGDFYYLFYSGNSYADGSYAIGVARSKSPMGPFEKEPRPILHSGPFYYGPGHNALVTDQVGNDYIVFHAHAKNLPADRREDLVAKVDWVNGWPRIGHGTPPSTFPAPGHTSPPTRLRALSRRP